MIIMKQCETMIDTLNQNGVNTEFYKAEFCDLIAIDPDERDFSELVDILEDQIRGRDLIDEDTLEEWKWARYEEHDRCEESRTEATVMDLVKEHPFSFAIHHHTKLGLSKQDVRLLLESGYQDCTSHNDETPSYYNGERIIYIYNPSCEFKVTDMDGEYIGTFKTMNEAV